MYYGNLSLALAILLPVSVPAGESYKIDPQNSIIQIRLDTTGILGFLGDKHLILAPISEGAIFYYPDEVEKSFVQLQFKTAEIKVQDSHLNDKDRREVQETMESERVLDVKDYPLISFRSTAVRVMKDGTLLIAGALTVRDVTQPVTLRAKIESTGPEIRARGNCRFKQTTFGIKPVTAGMGTVRVRDEVEITFQLHAVPVL